MATDIPASPTITAAPMNVYTVVGGSYVPPTVNEYAVMSIPAVWRAVSWLTGTLAGLPKGVVRESGDSCVYQSVKHPLNKLLARRMNPLTVPFVFWETFFHHAAVWGNGYGLISRESRLSSAAAAVINLNPEGVVPFRYADPKDVDKPPHLRVSQWYYVKGLNPKAKDPKDRDGIVPAADMIHVPGLGFDGMVGYPLVWILCESFEWARNVLRFGQRYLKKGTQIQGAIQVPANVTEDQIVLIRDQIRRNHSGIESDHSHLVLGGGATLNNSTIDPQKSQFIETKADAVVDIARIFGVSPWFLYELGRATWGNSGQMAEDAVKYSLRPWVEKTEEELNAKLLTDQEQDAGLGIRFRVEDLTRGDAKTLSTSTIAEVNGGIRTPNEGRAVLGLPPSDDPKAGTLRVAAPGQQGASESPAEPTSDPANKEPK